MGYVDESAIPTDETERTRWLFNQPATLELTHNYGKACCDGRTLPFLFGSLTLCAQARRATRASSTTTATRSHAVRTSLMMLLMMTMGPYRR